MSSATNNKDSRCHPKVSPSIIHPKNYNKCYFQSWVLLLPPSRSSSCPGCRQARSTSGGSRGGLRITLVANPPGNQPSREHRYSCAPQPVELPMVYAGPSTRSVPAVSLALLPTTGCRLLHRRVSRSFWRGRFSCAAAPAVAMPESYLEMMAMLSRATERVGLEWRPPPCPEPSRLDVWLLRVACAGFQHPALGASLPEEHGELTGRGQHLLLPETDLLTPPPSPPSIVVQLGGVRGPCGWL